MTKPLTVLKTVEDVDNAPDGTVVETTSGAIFAIVTQSMKGYVKKRLPARVLRWGEDLYPTVFEQVLKYLAQMKPAERENCHMAQCYVIGHSEPFVLFRIDDGERTAQLISKSGKLIFPNLDEVIPFLDLPRLVWPGEEPQETPVVSEWVGRELCTAQDFEAAPVGTVIYDHCGDYATATKRGDDDWLYNGESYTDHEISDYAMSSSIGYFTVVAVVEP
ncbi:hypothetical protein D881_03085 [Corynebacterium ulcerans NCTC 12077]|uniref:hypothetical protein n=1 Tax=Corynebacterium ulcerans TaxID=65058 RepID=UPI0003C7A3C3|nr:hypothetical protein [Corynebacterium ulcerans]ESU58839.1 hypothetical protein D881_03085 [Corynebacterium ulcerans NCTC 12077]